jgi:hypothetical protein
MLNFKDGVEWNNATAKATPYASHIIAVAHRVFDSFGYNCTVTSICDGRHSATSLHYRNGEGRAVDLRTRHIETQEQKETLTKALAAALGGSYDVVLERDHIHAERDGV